MSDIQQLLQQIPIDKVAAQAGVTEDEAREAVQQVLPALVGGMQANATDPAGASSLSKALGSHAGALDARLAGDVDVADGQKIVSNVFGGSTDQIATALGGGTGSALGGIIKKILPIIAPIVIAWIADKYFGGKGKETPADTTTQAPTDQAPTGGTAGGTTAPGGDNPFGRSTPTTAPGQAPGQAPAQPSGQPTGQPTTQEQGDGGIDLGSILGGILGGGSGKSSGGLGDILGGLLGGGKR